MSKFSVGDRVVVVSDEIGEGFWLFRKGQVANPEDGRTLSVRVVFEDDAQASFRPDELEFEHIYDALSAEPAVQVFGDTKSGSLTVDMSKAQGIFLDAVKVDSRPDESVSHPSHYTSHPSGVECIEITKHMGFLDGNALKYLWRYSLKNGIEDLRKCRQYLDWLIEAEEAKQ
jgi:hypothetical protein